MWLDQGVTQQHTQFWSQLCSEFLEKFHCHGFWLIDKAWGIPFTYNQNNKGSHRFSGKFRIYGLFFKMTLSNETRKALYVR